MSASLRRSDLLSLCNLRNDGRKVEEIRRLNIQMAALLSSGSSTHHGGSALVEMGLTQCLAMVRGPMDCTRRSRERTDRGILDVTVKVPPFAMSDRRHFSSNDRRILEISNRLVRVFESAILLHLFPKSQIEITVCILADDGGRLSAAINAVTLALMDAGIPMKDFVCACSAGHALNGDIVVDLNRREESSSSSGSHAAAAAGGNAIGYLSYAVLPQRGTVVLAQCESARLPNIDALQELMEAAMQGCRAVFERMQAALREHSAVLLSARQGHAIVQNQFPHH